MFFGGRGGGRYGAVVCSLCVCGDDEGGGEGGGGMRKGWKRNEDERLLKVDFKGKREGKRKKKKKYLFETSFFKDKDITFSQ